MTGVRKKHPPTPGFNYSSAVGILTSLLHLKPGRLPPEDWFVELQNRYEEEKKRYEKKREQLEKDNQAASVKQDSKSEERSKSRLTSIWLVKDHEEEVATLSKFKTLR